jgi:DNA-binding NarL/FixJ family response regulator
MARTKDSDTPRAPREDQPRVLNDDGAITVLIADDHRAFGEALQIALDKEHDLKVIEVVTDGPGAVEAAASGSPDVVLMDLQMPGMDGVEAAKRIRGTDDAPAVILLSGFDEDHSLGRAVQAGASGFLRKTEAVGWLADAIRRAHRGEPLHEPREIEESLRKLRRRRIADSGIARRLERLTPRELEILQRMTDGESTDQIAAELNMSPHTLRTHTQNVLTKLGLHSKLDAIVAAIRHGKVRTTEVLEDE